MLKYGNPISPLTSNSKSLIPRNLTYRFSNTRLDDQSNDNILNDELNQVINQSSNVSINLDTINSDFLINNNTYDFIKIVNNDNKLILGPNINYNLIDISINKIEYYVNNNKIQNEYFINYTDISQTVIINNFVDDNLHHLSEVNITSKGLNGNNTNFGYSSKFIVSVFDISNQKIINSQNIYTHNLYNNFTPIFNIIDNNFHIFLNPVNNLLSFNTTIKIIKINTI